MLFPTGATTLYNQFTPLKDINHYLVPLSFIAILPLQSNVLHSLAKSDWKAIFFYPSGYGVSFPPEEASGNSPHMVLHLVHDDSFGTDSQDQLSNHRPFLSPHTVEHNSILW